jgi:hypothetical protein
MNKLETKFAGYLENKKLDGQILWYAYEPVRLRLADKTTYTPDFMVMTSNLDIELWETKGFWTSESRIKIKVAAEIYPFKFYGVQWKNKKWEIEDF